MPSAPASRAGLTNASSRFATRTHGEQAVPAVAAIMACRFSIPVPIGNLIRLAREAESRNASVL
jgi:hypothetical protein